MIDSTRFASTKPVTGRKQVGVEAAFNTWPGVELEDGTISITLEADQHTQIEVVQIMGLGPV